MRGRGMPKYDGWSQIAGGWGGCGKNDITLGCGKIWIKMGKLCTTDQEKK